MSSDSLNVTTAQLLYPVRNFEAISSIKSGWQQDESPPNLNHTRKIVNTLGPGTVQTSPLPLPPPPPPPPPHAFCKVIELGAIANVTMVCRSNLFMSGVSRVQLYGIELLIFLYRTQRERSYFVLMLKFTVYKIWICEYSSPVSSLIQHDLV